VVFSLVVAIVVPRRNPDFPGRRMGMFFLVSLVLVGGMLATVEVYGSEGSSEAEAAPAETSPAAPVEPAPPAERGGGETAAPPATGDPAAGKEVFASAGCTACHTLADAGASGTVGPNLDQARPGHDLVVDRVTNGKGAMPPFKGQLSDQQIQDVAAYVVQATSG
jgi:mono/diheme cytochrome c family protein